MATPEKRRTILLCLTLPLIASGCGDASLPPSHPKFAEQYAELPGLSLAAHPGLQRELARLKTEAATPAQLQTDQPSFAHWIHLEDAPSEKTQAKNGAAALARVFTPGEFSRAADRIAGVYPRRLPPAPDDLRTANRTRRRYEAQRARFRVAAQRPVCEFGIEHGRGLLADNTFVDYVWAGCRLEGLLAIEQLARGRLDEALAAMRSMLRGASHLGRQKHLLSRLAAARIRADAWRILDYAARHKQTDAVLLKRLLTIVHEQLEHWPNDEWAWIGERAEGLHTFEIIRDGHLLSVLSRSEANRIEREHGMDVFYRAVKATIDEDEKFYLSWMRKVVSGCRRPYFESREMFQGLVDELTKLRVTEKYPRISDQVLLPHIQEGRRLQALDRARCQAWSLALSHAIGQTPRDYRVNPLTGNLLRVVRENKRIFVYGVGEDPDEPVAAPIMPLAAVNNRPAGAPIVAPPR